MSENIDDLRLGSGGSIDDRSIGDASEEVIDIDEHDEFLGAADTTWKALANCKESSPNLFFPIDTDNDEIPKAICSKCGVREECLEYALETKQVAGVWGGLNEKERRRVLLRER